MIGRAYEGHETRQLASALGYSPVVPRQNRRAPWAYDRERDKSRHAIERLFRRLKGVRRILSRFNQLDTRSFGFIQFARIVEALHECEQALA